MLLLCFDGDDIDLPECVKGGASADARDPLTRCAGALPKGEPFGYIGTPAFPTIISEATRLEAAAGFAGAFADRILLTAGTGPGLYRGFRSEEGGALLCYGCGRVRCLLRFLFRLGRAAAAAGRIEI